MHRMSVRAARKRQVIDLPSTVNKFISEQGFVDGLCNVCVLHPTAALSTADLDPGTDQDMLDAYTAMLPELTYRHPHDPEHTPDHILATLMGPPLSCPLKKVGLWFGTGHSVGLL